MFCRELHQASRLLEYSNAKTSNDYYLSILTYK